MRTQTLATLVFALSALEQVFAGSPACVQKVKETGEDYNDYDYNGNGNDSPGGPVVCTGFTDPEELQTEISLHPDGFAALHIEDGQLSNLPGLTQKLEKVTDLFLTSSFVAFPTSPVAYGKNDHITFFQNLPFLEKIEINNVPYLQAWNWEMTKTRQSVNLKIENCRFAVIPESLNTLNLLTLTVTNSQVHWIHRDAFKNAEFLSAINLGDNKIRKLEQDLFSTCKKLHKLDLSNNLLESLPMNLFRTGSEFKDIRLSGNPLKHLDFRTFQNINKIDPKSLYLNGTSLQCDCSYKWLLEGNIGLNLAAECLLLDGQVEQQQQPTLENYIKDNCAATSMQPMAL